MKNVHELNGPVMISKIECNTEVSEFIIPTEYFNAVTKLDTDTRTITSETFTFRTFMSTNFDNRVSMVIDDMNPTILFINVESKNRLLLTFDDIQTRNSFVSINFTHLVTKIESIEL